MLARALRAERLAPGARVLDVCAGSGALAVAAALGGAEATAVDVSRGAVLTARLNGRRNGVRVRARRGDLLEAVAGERFDAIVSNPPYLPAPGDALPAGGAERAWDAGRDGRVLLDRLLAAAPGHLRPSGVLLVVHSALCGVDRSLAALRDGGLEASIAVHHRGPLGPLLRARAPWLEAEGLLAPGEREEDVVVVRAVRPAVPGRNGSGAASCGEDGCGRGQPPDVPARGRG
jgi:release factor glutamine methyltransferase